MLENIWGYISSSGTSGANVILLVHGDVGQIRLEFILNSFFARIRSYIISILHVLLLTKIAELVAESSQTFEKRDAQCLMTLGKAKHRVDAGLSHLVDHHFFTLEQGPEFVA